MARFEAMEDAERVGVNGPVNVKAMLAEQLRAEGKEKTRQQLLQAKATSQIERDVRTFAFRHGPDIVKAAYALFEDFAQAGYQSARGRMNALIGAAHTELGQFLHAFRRSAVSLKRFNRPMLDDVVKALFGEAASPEAQAFADGVAKVFEKLRLRFNDLGGTIGKLEKWGLPQSHNDSALLHAGFDAWRDYISPRLDWQSVKHAITETPILPAEREGVLRSVFNNIVSDGQIGREPTMAPKGTPLYAQRSDPRFLRFRDATSWLEYSRQFGHGDPFATIMDHIRSMSRDIALMERFGPNPRATLRWLQQVIEAEGAKQKLQMPTLFDTGTKPRRVDFAVKRANYMLDGLYDAARGFHTPYSTTGTLVSILRNVEYSAKLGSAVVTHTFANPVIQAMGRYLKGHSVLSVPMEIFKGMTKAELSQTGMILEDAMHTMERGAREQGALLRVREFSNWLPKWTTHYSGLDGMVNANRRAAFLGQMTTVAQNLHLPWAELPERLKDTMAGAGLTADDWAVMQKAAPYQTDWNAPFLRFQDIQKAEGVEPAEADRVAMNYLTMLHSVNEALVPTSTWRVRAATSGVDRIGGLPAEVVKSALMFKGGFMSTFMITQWQMLRRELATHGLGSTAAYATASAIALTIAGMMTLQVKNLINGKDARNMDPTTKEGLETWGHAALTSGALGIYGDFIASDRSSYGHDLLATLAGPMVTSAEDAYHEAGTLGSYGLSMLGLKQVKKAPNPDADVVRMLRNDTPVLSTHWALRAAYNRILLDQLQYLADPDAHRKMRMIESRVRKETGQGYFWKPGAMLPDRLPEASAH